jgi:hypothetical protein
LLAATARLVFDRKYNIASPLVCIAPAPGAIAPRRPVNARERTSRARQFAELANIFGRHGLTRSLSAPRRARATLAAERRSADTSFASAR